MSTDTRAHEEIEIRRLAKRALRNQMRAVRAALPASACDARSAAITKRLLDLGELERAHTVLCFASIGNEVRTGALINAMWDAGKRVALPRVVADELELRLVDRETSLIEGAFSVPEPDQHAPLLPAEEVDFALIPALAVDPRGFRIGYGGGYYDGLLPQLSHACACAVAYDFQVISEVPELAFDAPVAVVVTDRRVIRIE